MKTKISEISHHNFVGAEFFTAVAAGIHTYTHIKGVAKKIGLFCEEKLDFI